MPITWLRPSGAEIQTNEEKGTVEAAERLGWKRKSEKTPQKPSENVESTGETPNKPVKRRKKLKLNDFNG